MFKTIDNWWNKKMTSLKYELNSALIVSFMVIIAYVVTNPILNMLDEEYGLNMYIWFLLSHMFKLMPFILDEYKRYSKNCTNLSVFSKLYFSFKNAMIQVGITDIVVLVSSMIPIIGNIVGMLGMVPIIGDPLLFVGAYLFQVINEHLNPLYYLQKEFMEWIVNNIFNTKFGSKCANPYFILSLGAMGASMGAYTYNEVTGMF
tara:strand:- start:3585 stop:4193 length:609 start_codon:yes stop_codon:yes gene_type:complete